MSNERDKLYDLCVECQRRVGSLLLTLILLCTLYWLSFFLFREDARRTLIAPARGFVAAVNGIEQDHVAWQTIHQADIARLIAISDRYLAQLERLPPQDPARTTKITLDVQARLSDHVLTDFLSRTNAQSYVDAVRRWNQELKSLSLNKIVYVSEVLDLYVSYGTLNLPPGWATMTAQALDLHGVGPIPAELDTLPWQDMRGRMNVLFAPMSEFETTIQSMQTLWQGEITDEMQARALHGTGIWLRNLESGRSIAQGFVRKEPNIRLPLLGENISGRWAFYIAPIILLILMRYWRELVQHIRLLETELMVVRDEDYPTIIRSTSDETLSRLARYPNLIEVLRTQPASARGVSRSTMNRLLVGAVLLLPLSTSVAIIWVDWTISVGAGRVILTILALSAYFGMAADTLGLLQYYGAKPVAATPRRESP